MATTEFEEEPAPSQAEQVRRLFTDTLHDATDTQQESGLSLRIFVLLLVIAGCLLFAPMPASFIGVLAVVILALSTGIRRRR